MILVDPEIRIEPFNGLKIMKNLENYGKTCYKSNNNITEDSYNGFLKGLITRGHTSVIEHEKITVHILCDVGFYKDITRHRHASFSVESTRYCNYSKDKFDNQIRIIKPCNLDEDTAEYEFWKNAMEDMEAYYMDMSNIGCTADQLRMILPHSTAAEITMTANIREWRHILSLRADNHAHPSIQQIMIPFLLYLQEQMPILFEDIEYNKDFPKEKYSKLIVLNEEN